VLNLKQVTRSRLWTCRHAVGKLHPVERMEDSAHCRIKSGASWVAALLLRFERFIILGALLAFLTSCASVEPVNVFGGVFFNQSCAQAHPIYTVPAGKLLIIEDASVSAVNSATASIPNNPGIVADIPVKMSLRTNPTGTIPFGSTDHIIVSGVGLPIAGGRTIKGYAAPGTQVLFLLGLCTVDVNTSIYFSGRLVDYP